jgi:hypothetical protein
MTPDAAPTFVTGSADAVDPDATPDPTTTLPIMPGW